MSKTELMLDHLVRGMQEEGAEVERVDLNKRKIRTCIGCFTCWTKTPGLCVHKDDMTKEIYPKYLAADLAVLATPLYHYTVNALMKTFIERTLPSIEPFFESRKGVTRHPVRDETPPVVILSVAGFPEDSVFDHLSRYVNFLYQGKLVAEIYRAAAETMASMRQSRTAIDILDATVQGGGELVRSGALSGETLARIRQPLTDVEEMSLTVNVFWQTCIDEQVSPKEFVNRGMVPRPDSAESFLAIMKAGFNPESAGDTRGTIQFQFSGQVEEVCHFAIDQGEFACSMGLAKEPDLVVRVDFDLWMDILTGKADGAAMFMEEKYTTSGDISLLMKLNELFGR